MKIDQSKITRNLMKEVSLPDCHFFRKEAEDELKKFKEEK